MEERLLRAEAYFDTYHIRVRGGRISIDGSTEGAINSAEDMADLIGGLPLPDLVIHASVHDIGPYIYGDDFRLEVHRLLGEGRRESPTRLLKT